MSTISFDKTSLGEIICEMQQNDKIDDKFKIVNAIKDLRIISVFRKIPSKPIKNFVTISPTFPIDHSIPQQIILIMKIL